MLVTEAGERSSNWARAEVLTGELSIWRCRIAFR
jgi:hypothetical protein